MEFERTIPILRMFDIPKTRAFYLDFLGFKVDFEHRFSETAPLFMQVSRDNLVFHLSEHHGDGSPGVHVTVMMKGLDAFHAEVAAKAYRYFNPAIKEQFWGARTMAVLDPCGNRIAFTEPKA
jgi:catechol 2,3-dioxygenase-like lactoylglutathione lyase family enzyme